MADRENIISHLQIVRTWAAVGPSIEGRCLEDTVAWIDDALELLKADEKMNTRKPVANGKWTERKADPDITTIDEWQSARCSNCGRYHTTPYIYYFKNYSYCPNCGAKMEGGEDG